MIKAYIRIHTRFVQNRFQVSVEKRSCHSAFQKVLLYEYHKLWLLSLETCDPLYRPPLLSFNVLSLQNFEVQMSHHRLQEEVFKCTGNCADLNLV
jgi:hypothetical protein